MPINDPEIDAILSSAGGMPDFSGVQSGASSTAPNAAIVDPEIDAILAQAQPTSAPPSAESEYTKEHYVPFTNAYYALPKSGYFGNVQERLKPYIGMNVSPRDVVKAAPLIGATAATIGTGGAAFPTIIAAGLGGAGGKFISDTAEAKAEESGAIPQQGDAVPGALDVLGAGLKEGVEQGAYEAAGLGAAKTLSGPLSHFVAALRPKVLSAVDKVVDEFGLAPQVRGFAKKIVATTVLGRRVVGMEQEQALSRVADEVSQLGTKTTGKAVPPPVAHPETVIEEIDNILKVAKSQDDAAVQAAQDLRTAAAQGAHDQAIADAAAKVATIRAVSAQTIADAEKASAKLIETMAAEKPTMVAATKAGAQAQLETELNALAQKMDTDIAGQTIRQGAVGRGSEAASGAAIGARQAENLYATASQAAEGVQVPIADFKVQAEQFLEKMRMRPEPERALENLGTELGAEKALPKNVQRAMAENAELQRKAQAMGGTFNEEKKKTSEEFKWLEGKLGEIQGPTMPFEKAREIQQWLAAHLPWEKVSQTQQKGIYKSLWGTLTEKMEGALAENGALQPFQEANSFWRHYADIFKRGAVSKLMTKDPEAVIGLVMGKEGGLPSRAKALREAVVGFAERYGTEEEKAAAQSTWQLFQRQFAEKKLLAGGLEGFEKASAKVGDETLNALYGDEVGSQALKNLKDISQAYRDAEKAIQDTVARRTEEIKGAVSGLKAQSKADIAQAASEAQGVKKTAGETLAAEKKSIKGSPPQIDSDRLADQARLEMIRKAVTQSNRSLPQGTGLGGYITPGFLIYGLARHAVTSLGIVSGVEIIGDMTARAMFHPAAARTLIDGLQAMAHGSTTGMLRFLDWYMKDRQTSLAPPSATESGPPPQFTPVQGLHNQPPPAVAP